MSNAAKHTPGPWERHKALPADMTEKQSANWWCDRAMETIYEVDRLRAENAELLAALKAIYYTVANNGWSMEQAAFPQARAAIARAKGEA